MVSFDAVAGLLKWLVGHSSSVA
jgi:hypothetical protein